ncbi:MAG: WYL domain-containing protein [Clostridia bacterium]|nr:WYL domain-containing protein [Clostridia bacterium]
MIFSELYSAYYNAVAGVLKEAADHPVTARELRRIAEREAFGESSMRIEQALMDEEWQLLRKDGTTPIRHVPTMPLTILQRRWLKAVMLDPRIQLFTDDIPDDPEVEPLFWPEDVCVFDRYLDGDPYEDAEYIRHFRMILEAVRTKEPLEIMLLNRKKRTVRMTIVPEYLEYSEKDDKFRLIGKGNRFGNVINLGRIVACRKYDGTVTTEREETVKDRHREVELELWDRRNALERALLHFAHFEKEAEKIETDHYRLRIRYDKDDETEMVIRILSFGPMVKVVSPDSFAELIKERLIRQKRCGL